MYGSVAYATFHQVHVNHQGLKKRKADFPNLNFKRGVYTPLQHATDWYGLYNYSQYNYPLNPEMDDKMRKVILMHRERSILCLEQ